MNNHFQKIVIGLIPVLLAILVQSCASESEKYVKQELSRSNKALAELCEQCRSCKSSLTAVSVARLEKKAASSDLDVDDGVYGLTPEQNAAISRQRRKVDSIRTMVEGVCREYVKNNYKVIVDDEPLVEGIKVYSFYLKKGTRLFINCSASGPAVAKFYNADSQKLIRTYSKAVCSDSLEIANSAIYLFELTATTSQYCDVEIMQKVYSIDEFFHNPEISVEVVETTAGSFRAQKVPGIDMVHIFEEPHRYTLRSRLKEIWDMTNSTRSVAAVKVPVGATDVLYRLRISTADSESSSDGQFCENIYSKYRKIKFAGLPLYESTTNHNTLFRELLNSMSVQREENAYCNLYVFTSAAQAKKFQERVDISKLVYDLDNSAQGTQSRNERLHIRGGQTVYFGFENTRQRYDVYLWLEALATVPKNVYYTEKYSLK